MFPFPNPMSGGGAAATIRFNPADKGPGAVLSNGNLSLTGGAARTTPVIPATGLWCAEFTLSVAGINANGVGISTAAGDLTSSSPGGSDALGYGYRKNGDWIFNGSVSGAGATQASGDIIGVAVDTTNLRLWFSKNGVWQFGGNPSAGTGSISIVGGTYYFQPSATLGAAVWNINFAPVYPPPVGFRFL